MDSAIGRAGVAAVVCVASVLVVAWSLVDFVAVDIVAKGAEDIGVLGHPRGETGPVTFRRYKYDGTLLATCERLPQPSEPTAEGTVVCPAPTPGAEAWRYGASGKVAAGPAVGAAGTTYWATQRGLLYALDCAGRRKWLFEYRVESGGYGAEAFEGAPAVDEDGTLYIGDDVMVPNYFFAIAPDGKTKWVQHYESLYSQIDTSPALGPDGHIFAAAHGWGAGVDHGAILVLHRDGRLLRPAGAAWSEDGVGPIVDAPAVLADGSAAYVAPPFEAWVLPSGTPPTVTPVSPRPTRTPTPEGSATTPGSGSTPGTPAPSATSATPTAPATQATMTATITATMATVTATPTAHSTAGTPPATVPTPESPLAWVYLPWAAAGNGQVAACPSVSVASSQVGAGRSASAAGPSVSVASAHVAAGRSAAAAGPAQPLPPPYVTQPIPARLRLVRAGVLPDVVVDLPGLSDPSAPATVGLEVWFTAAANDGAHLLAYRAGDPPALRLDANIAANVAACPILGRADPDTGLLEVVLLGDDGRLVVLDASVDRETATTRWSRFIGLPAAGAPALGDDGRVYAAAGEVVQALERATGDVVWSLHLDSPASGSVNLAPGGMLHVATASGEVLAIGTSASGLDPMAAWPAFRRDARNTGSSRGAR